jgi:phage regulator Rha-like protein
MLTSVSEKLTMSHLEIAEVVSSRPDKVKQSMERLENKGLIKLTPMREVNHRGQNVTVYHVSKRDSYIVVAQLSPEFTAALVDRWQELEEKSQPSWLAQLSPEAKIAIADIAKQRDEALATKAQINDKRTATLMNKASQDAKKIKRLENQLQDQGGYLSLIAARLPQRVDTEFKSNVQTWRILKQISEKMGHEIIKVYDPRYGQANTYHLDVIEKFKEDYL